MAALPIYEGPVGRIYGNYLSGESIGRLPTATSLLPEREVDRVPSLEVLESAAISLGGLAACVEPVFTGNSPRAVRSGRVPITDVHIELI